MGDRRFDLFCAVWQHRRRWQAPRHRVRPPHLGPLGLAARCC